MTLRPLGSRPRVGVIGATGMVGGELVRLLEERAFPAGALRLFSSRGDPGASLEVWGRRIPVEALRDEVFGELDLVFLAAGRAIAETVAPQAIAAGCTVIDNSSAFRARRDVPLVVPEINAEALAGHAGLIANPNCSTILNALAAAPLARAFGLDGMVVATYQAASGAGLEGAEELRAGARAHLEGRSFQHCVFSEALAFNLIPMIGAPGPDGFTEEEEKMRLESQRILSLPDLAVTTTCVRVPVERCHGLATTFFLTEEVDVERARQVLAGAPGLLIDPCPTPRKAAGNDQVLVGRLRSGGVGSRALSLFLVGDQVRKGAALNAVQIAEALISRELAPR